MIFLFLSSLISCTPPVTSMLLSDYKTCEESNTCPNSNTTIGGTLQIQPDSQSPVNVDAGDLVEIAGTCKDLGLRDNFIKIEAFESEDESLMPYVRNTDSPNCMNSSLPALNGTKCLVVTAGAPLVDANSGLEYPRCFNGRFAFQLRLGKINRQNPLGALDDATNPKLNYLVRMKLSSPSSTPQDSIWSTVVISRGVSAPQFSLASSPGFARIEIKTRPFSFRNMGYIVQRTGTPISGTVPVVANVFPVTPMVMTYPDLNDGSFITNYFDLDASSGGGRGMLPGMTYTYSMTAVDYTYTPNETSLAAVQTIVVDPPTLIGNGGSATHCFFTLSSATGHTYQWDYSTTQNWQRTNPSATNIPTCTTSACAFPKPGTGSFHLAVRAIHNPTGYVGAWSKESINCTFN